MPAVMCSKCAADLPDGSQFCLKCGQPVGVPDGTAVTTAIAVLACSKCGATLPEGAEFCAKCGKPVSIPAKTSGVRDPAASSKPIPPLPQRKFNTGRMVALSLLAVLVGGLMWAATSDHPFAQGIQELVGWTHDQTILETPFTVSAHNFRYYKFSLPEGSMHVAIVGQFGVSPEGNKKSRKDANDTKSEDTVSDIEVYVLSEPAFTVWQNGYVASSVYESGRVSHGSLQADLPAGAGIYYLVFSNKFAPKEGKSVDATVLLRYKSWLPESLRRMKDRFLNWLSL
ncbi:MAG TPA: zinc ribbon domain-containing protein [Candidatus Acidoferrum sp.]|nr:zinc ribbon domain-containing protein [Candidatus Acidoferrum sp.]